MHVACTCFPISWLDPLIWRGYKRELKQKDLYIIPKELESQALLKCFNRLVISIVTVMLLV